MQGEFSLKRCLNIPTIYGNTTGLKKGVIQSLERIYRRRIPPNHLITPELCKYIASLSYDIKRQIGIIANREGNITHVIVGDFNSVFIPSLEDYKIGRSPLRRLRFIHTHLTDDGLNKEDLTDLALLRFDILCAVTIREGIPHKVHYAYLMPHGSDSTYEIVSKDFYQLDINFKSFIDDLESQMQRQIVLSRSPDKESAILVGADVLPKYVIEESIEELRQLAESAGVEVLDTTTQRLKEINPKYLLGEGKLNEIIINAMQKGATLLIFDRELSPSQARAIADKTELKVIDRTQLILDIFARRAHSRDGKVQVELAQLKYMLPRLTGKGTAMSRLMGGIGGRGPGEMKLEIDRRRIRERITRLEEELKTLTAARLQRKKKRIDYGIPIISIVGYTNAGKSTLLNALTKSDTFVEDKMFATLDTATRRLRFPREREAIITDTVGFIRDLPSDLMAAFKATLEELNDAHLLIHLVDISNPLFHQHIQSVNGILKDLGLDKKPTLLVFNKIDLINNQEVQYICSRYGGIGISANNKETLLPLLTEVEGLLWQDLKERID
ncbi:MAG: GTPase HflX [Thermodesulfovibrionales bacterium]|nr:GTPase HflX [Thermodesulfovibrionales bacterium]